MATSRLQGRCRVSALEDDGHDDAVIIPKTASVTPLAGSTPSTPPRKNQVFGLVTPLATPDSRSRLNPLGFHVPSPPSTPVKRPNVLKDTKALPLPGNPSERSSDQLAIIPSLPPAGLLTPDNTPPRLNKPRFVPIRYKEETAEKPKPTLSLETTSTVVEFSEISEHHAEDIQYVRNSKVKIQCNGITKRGRQCLIQVNASERYCHHHDAQGPPAVPSANVKDSQRHPSDDAPAKPTTKVKIRCNGITKRGGRQCLIQVNASERYCHHHDAQGPPSVPSANVKDTQRRQSEDTTAKPTTGVNSQCRGLTQLHFRCKRSVKPPAQCCHQHQSQSNNTLTTSTTPAASTTAATPLTNPTARITVQCSGTAKSTKRRCQKRVSITPGSLTKDSSQPIYCHYHIPTPEGTVTHVKIVTYVDEDGFKVQPVGREEVPVRFCDWIPGYLQPDTQRELRTAITKKLSERARKPGYVYALNMSDLGIEGKLSLKIGYSNDVKIRHAWWQKKCHSSIKDVRGWWPETIIEIQDDDDKFIQKLIRNDQQGDMCPMAEQLERLVHIELRDLATHAPYLHPDFPDICFSDVRRLPKAVREPCRDCKTKHKEIFSFTRVKEGEFFEREWEDIVKPVIRRWGTFLKEYFAQGGA